MRSSKRWTIWVSAAIVAVVSYGIVYAVISHSNTPAGAPDSYHACRASQIRVTSGPTLFNTSYDNLDEHLKFKAFANEAVPVYFFNKGADCHLLMGAPTIRAARKIPVTDSSSTTNLSFPFTANERRLLIVHDEKIEALFVVIKPSAVLGHPCDPSATSGVFVGGYATPISSSHFIRRNLHYVCFDSGVGRLVENTGTAWISWH